MSLQEMLQQCLEIGHTFHYHPDIRSYIAYIASTFLTPYSDVVGYQSFQGPCWLQFRSAVTGVWKWAQI